jgi:hypothetical protein
MFIEILNFALVSAFSYILLKTLNQDTTQEYPFPFPEESIPRFQR